MNLSFTGKVISLPQVSKNSKKAEPIKDDKKMASFYDSYRKDCRMHNTSSVSVDEFEKYFDPSNFKDEEQPLKAVKKNVQPDKLGLSIDIQSLKLKLNEAKKKGNLEEVLNCKKLIEKLRNSIKK